MRVFEEKHKLQLPKSHGRSKGLHVSDVIRDLAVNGKVLDKKWISELSIELQDTSLMQVGLAWEDYIEKSGQHPEIEYHPGELKMATELCAICGDENWEHICGDYDHEFETLWIYMSPDGFTIKDGYLFLCLNELKFTKKSCRDFADGLRMGSKKSLMYVWQIASYLKGVGALVAKLHVMFINGNYSFNEKDPESGSVYRVYRLEFSESEIESNWRMVTSHAQRMVKSGKYKHEAKEIRKSGRGHRSAAQRTGRQGR